MRIMDTISQLLKFLYFPQFSHDCVIKRTLLPHDLLWKTHVT